MIVYSSHLNYVKQTALFGVSTNDTLFIFVAGEIDTAPGLSPEYHLVGFEILVILMH